MTSISVPRLVRTAETRSSVVACLTGVVHRTSVTTHGVVHRTGVTTYGVVHRTGVTTYGVVQRTGVPTRSRVGIAPLDAI